MVHLWLIFWPITIRRTCYRYQPPLFKAATFCLQAQKSGAHFRPLQSPPVTRKKRLWWRTWVVCRTGNSGTNLLRWCPGHASQKRFGDLNVVAVDVKVNHLNHYKIIKLHIVKYDKVKWYNDWYSEISVVGFISLYISLLGLWLVETVPLPHAWRKFGREIWCRF